MAERFKIIWHDATYRVSIPNYHGGEVVDAALFDEALRLMDGLLGLEKGSGQAAFDFIERHRADVGGSGQ